MAEKTGHHLGHNNVLQREFGINGFIKSPLRLSSATSNSSHSPCNEIFTRLELARRSALSPHRILPLSNMFVVSGGRQILHMPLLSTSSKWATEVRVCHMLALDESEMKSNSEFVEIFLFAHFENNSFSLHAGEPWSGEKRVEPGKYFNRYIFYSVNELKGCVQVGLC
jgi:hypothetical protein